MSPSMPVAAWHAALDAIADNVAVLDASGEIVAVNRAWLAYGAANGGGAVRIGGNYLAVCERAAAADPTAADVGHALREILDGDATEFTLVYPCHSPTEQRWFTVRLARLEGAGPDNVIVVHQDVTLREQAERRSREQAELLEAVGAATTVTDPHGLVREWSAGAERLYGWSAAEAVGRPFPEITLAEGNHGSVAEIGHALATRGEWEGQLVARRRDGSTVSVTTRHRLLRGADGELSGVVAIAEDNSARVAAERELNGIRGFRNAVLQTMPDGLCVLDAGGRITFVNEAAERMLGWGSGDLLGVVMQDVVRATTADGRPYAAGADAGAAVLPAGANARVDDDVFQRGDGTELPVSYSSAPFTAESGERGSLIVFSDITDRKDAELRAHRRLDELAWVGRIRVALEEDRFVLFAQPIVDIATGRTVQHELLLRMLGGDGELIAPGEFLPVAEEHGLIKAVDRHVLNLALGFASQGHAIEVNVSAASIGDPVLFDYVQDQMRIRGVDPRLVVFELTETALIDNEAAAESFARQVVALGSAVALDDFGTGYGGFHYLRQLPVDILKIDREFVRDLDGTGDSEASRHVIKAIVSLAIGMGKATVAEGVETQAQLDAVRALGVDCAQGYLFARPAPAREVLEAFARLSA